MNNKKSVSLKQKYKTVFSLLATIALVLCAGLMFAGCGDDRVTYKDAIKIARENFGCKKILWTGYAYHNGTLTSDIVYTENGGKYYQDRVGLDRGGHYVFGLDKNGNEVYVVVPCYISSTDKPTKIDWPFYYTYSEMLDFAGQFGYKYSEGIEGHIDEFIEERYSLGMDSLAREDIIDEYVGYIRYESLSGRFNDLLDVKFAFRFRKWVGKEFYDYVIGQIDGKLIMLEVISADWDNLTVNTYNRTVADE